MRTTIELSSEHRARLLDIAARRHEKGFSSIIAEAVAEYLVRRDDSGETKERALAVRGCLTADEAAALKAATTDLRGSWR